MTQISAKFFASLVSDTEAVQDDWTQRLKENPHDPLEEIRQEHEEFLTQLEGLAVEAIATNNWDAFYSHVVDFQNENDLHGESLIAIGIEDANRGSLTTENLTPDNECYLTQATITEVVDGEASADELETRSADLPPTKNQIND